MPMHRNSKRIGLPVLSLTGVMIACFLLLGLPFPVAARDLALLVGVGHYRNPAHDLPGIDQDLDLMRTVVSRLGFAAPDTLTLADAEATVPEIRRMFHEVLEPGAGAADRVLFYFTGHGGQVPDVDGDESDGSDEVLATYDLDVVGDPVPTLNGVLVDDELHKLLTSLRSRHVLVFIDACHSGTAAKGIELGSRRNIALRDRSLGSAEGQPKFFYYPGMPISGTDKAILVHEEAKPADDFALLAAAADYEKALATNRGSIFTRGIWDAVELAVRQGAARMTLADLQNASDVYIDRYVQTANREGQQHHPQLTGNPQLMRLNLFPKKHQAPAAPEGETNASRLRRLAETAEPLILSLMDGAHLEEGDLLRLQVEIPAPKGYLNLLDIDARDQIRVLFPNRFHPDNQVGQGRLELPDPACLLGPGCFDWPVQAPFGSSQLVALWTRRPLNLFEASDGSRDADGKVLDRFPAISFASTRAVTAESALRAGIVNYHACPYQQPCND